MEADKTSSLVNAVKRLKQSGRVFTKKDLADYSGLNPSIVYLAASQEIIKCNPKSVQIATRLNEEMKNGTLIYKIREKLDITPSALYQTANSIHILLEDRVLSEPEVSELLSLISKEDKSLRIASLALQGYPVTKIGNETGLTREGARIYISGLGLHSTWKEKRKAKINEKLAMHKQLNSSRSTLLSVVISYLEKRLNSLPNIERRAFDYYIANSYRRSKDATPYEKIVRLISSHENAKGRATIEELAEDSEIAVTSITTIMRALNLKPRRHIKTHRHTSNEKRNALSKALDISYLTREGVKELSHLSLFNINGDISHKHDVSEKEISISDNEIVRYSKASNIYEALDLGFSQKETAFLEDTTLNAVKYCKRQRNEIAPKIIHALKTIFPRARITKPYYKPSFDEIYK